MAAISAVALLVCYASTLYAMGRQWCNDEDMRYAFLVPLVVGWIVWRERRNWMSLTIEPSLWGAAMVLLGALLHLLGVLGAGLFVSSLAFLVSVAGVVLWLGGGRLMRAWAFPLLLCLFMLPKLAIAYNRTTLPLQLLASRLAAGMLSSAGIGVIRSGNILDVGGHRVLVADAANGIRYLLALGFIGVLLAYLSNPSPWMRLGLLAVSMPLAILANAVAVAMSAWVPGLNSGAAHVGMESVVFLSSAAVLASAARRLGRVSLGRRV